ncbi:MAG TPA: ATP-binding cassette domain-containing protein [Thermodesulfobacteriota bacterium]|jgi:putative ABC transport system ATP-binding protein|nr:ATP-binding cassette domain-containing protein [Thermodesulfobacteriota bacterium]
MRSEGEMVIKVKNLTLSAENRILCSGVSFEMGQGDKAILFGPSGCGKSSLLRALVGLRGVDSGSIEVGGVELSLATQRVIHGRIAFLQQEPVMGAETVREALLLPFTFKQNAPLRPDPDKIAETLEQVGLFDIVLDRPASQLSGGEKQRIAIARALLMNRDIIFADEITAALDSDSRDKVIAVLRELPVTLLAVTHDPVFRNAFSIEYRMENKSLRKVRP